MEKFRSAMLHTLLPKTNGPQQSHEGPGANKLSFSSRRSVWGLWFSDFSSSSWEYTWMKQHDQKLRGYYRIITWQDKKCTKSVLMRSKFKNIPKKVNYVKNIMAMFYPGMYNDLGRKKKSCKQWDELPIKWCGISSINSIIPTVFRRTCPSTRHYTNHEHPQRHAVMIQRTQRLSHPKN